MNTLELTTVLEECLGLAGREMPTVDEETVKRTKGLLSAELSSLLQEAVDMKWPFVEEKWQYKRSVAPEDKVNTSDLVSQHLPELMAFLRASILGAKPLWAMSAVFLLDRFLYWIDSSHTLLKIAKALHRHHPETPVAPQIVIRQARVYLNTGKLQKAEYILSSLINNSGTTGCWKYHQDSDRTLVQAVSVQVRGQVLQKLGLWLEAAELIWASLIGFHVLPLPDKKGVGTSLGILASVLVSMNDNDFATFQKRPHINLMMPYSESARGFSILPVLQDFLGDCRHRLLCAAQAAKMAVVYSQFNCLYVLTHMVTQGTCLLSYSFSKNCPAAEKKLYLALARDAFENGLLTMAERDVVTSQLELHTLIKAAYCLAITNKWMFGPTEEVTLAFQACQEAIALLYSYCFKDDFDKVVVSSEVMRKVQRVKSILKVKAFANSDPCSFIPDSYREMADRPVPFTLPDFTKMMESFQKHHKSVCEAFRASKQEGRKSGQCTPYANCITAFQTTLTESLATECNATSQAGEANEFKKPEVSPDPPIVICQKETLEATLDSDEHQPDLYNSRDLKLAKKSEAQTARTSQGSSSLGSSWLNVSNSGASLVLVDPFCCTEADDDDGHGVHNEKVSHGSQAEPARNIGNACKGAKAANASSQTHGVLEKGANAQHQSKQELCTTLESEDNHPVTNNIDANNKGKGKDSVTSLSSSLGSSWQSISFSRSPPNGTLSEILKDKSIIDQNCETVATEDGPDSPFELINHSPSAIPISRGGQTTLLKTGGKTQKGCHPQTSLKDQSAIETVEDPEVSFLSDALYGFPLPDNHPNGLKAKNASATPQEGHLSKSNTKNDQVKASLLSTELDSFELLHLDQSNLKVTQAGEAKHNDDVETQVKSNVDIAPPFKTEAEDYKPTAIPSEHIEHLDKKDKEKSSSDKHHTLPTRMDSCNRCFRGCTTGSVVLTEQDYRSLFSGVCQSCLLKRLPDKTFKLSQYYKAYSALVLKYSKASDMWTSCETSVYVGELLQVAVKGGQRQAFRIQYLHQEQLLGSYVGKEYLKERKAHVHLADVERQMTAQYYIMEFNKRLYENNITTQIFYIPSELLLITEADSIVACVSVEPYMLGDFVKLTNNTTKTDKRYSTTEYGIAFGHFTYEFSNREEVVVDLQGWVTANGKGLAYLTDPQIHSLRKPKSSSNFHQNGIRKFLREQHGEHCGPICRAALHTLTQHQQ